MKLLATTGFGLEGVLKNELVLLGKSVLEVLPGNVLYEGDMEDVVLSNLSLRTADRIFILLKEFEAKSFDELFDGVRSFPFEDYMGERARVLVRANSNKSVLYSTQNIQKITKKAVATRFSSIYGIKKMMEDGLDYPLTVKIDSNRARLLLETTGEPLFKRGYRFSGRIAPLRENMAAALVLLSRYFGKGVFRDPMCGSGTLLIEAALIARNIAPGLNRNFLFESWGYIKSKKLREELKERILPRAEFPILGSDLSKEAIDLAHRNIRRAGVLEDIQLEHVDLADLRIEEEGGTLVSNAPYGERMGSSEEILQLDQVLEEKILSLETWRLGLLLGHGDFAKKHRRKPQKIRRLNNGPLRTFYYQYEPIKKW